MKIPKDAEIEIKLLLDYGFEKVRFYDEFIDGRYYDAIMNGAKIEVWIGEKVQWRYFGVKKVEDVIWNEIKLGNSEEPIEENEKKHLTDIQQENGSSDKTVSNATTETNEPRELNDFVNSIVHNLEEYTEEKAIVKMNKGISIVNGEITKTDEAGIQESLFGNVSKEETENVEKEKNVKKRKTARRKNTKKVEKKVDLENNIQVINEDEQLSLILETEEDVLKLYRR